ncbi:hypothetical protein BJ508DRAFT_115935 [Ascobolus immersus RN42]|uniref:Uncharacterized protein n=1 Tax=Ascobolus immersus RN42 TaxID=1160509 RepID=A0A3N4I5A0_ASCIM|nr:hypothetical protein BJ508DRAFT_115935 [Ascobolus immersus RN42]
MLPRKPKGLVKFREEWIWSRAYVDVHTSLVSGQACGYILVGASATLTAERLSSVYWSHGIDLHTTDDFMHRPENHFQTPSRLDPVNPG